MITCAIAQARMGSTRFPGKVLKTLGDIPVLEWVLSALYSSDSFDHIVLATSTLPADDVIAEYCDVQGWNCFRGSETDVLDRFYQCATKYKADVIVRVTCDCPFLDPTVISEVVRLQEMTNAHYCSNIDPPTWPDGLDVECFTFEALEAAWREATRASDRDCVTQYIVRNRSRFSSTNLTCPLPGLHKERWVLDTEADYRFCCEIAKHNPTSYLDILTILDKEPELRKINNASAGATRNERFFEGIYTEPLPERTYERSKAALGRATRRIPFGAQTFSKSHLQFPVGRAPLYVSHADGARIFDIDGNDYIDLVGALLPVILGYRDPDVDNAIRRQLDSGISLSLATELEAELAETLVRLIPCAEMVKFGKNGTDVTSAAVRLARAYTGKSQILALGYHGWADWALSQGKYRLGIPEGVEFYTYRPLMELDEIATLIRGVKANNEWGAGGDVACIILEPNDDPSFLRGLRKLCDDTGTILIFDEIITGFRYGLGGAQELYGVTPDLACFGKAMGNGMPISALVGRRDIMLKMQPPDNIFYSGTFFGETLSIAAAIATIEKLKRENVVDHLLKTGIKLEKHVLGLVNKHSLKDFIGINGWYTRQVLSFRGSHADKMRSLFIEKMAQNGVLIINSHNLSFAHKEPELKRIRSAYDATFQALHDAIYDGTLEQQPTTEAAPLRSTG